MYVYFLVVFLDRVHVRRVQEAKTDARFFVIEQVHMADSKLVWRRPAELSKIIFTEWHFVNVQKYRQ